jgi:superfamily II DNA/RNA helicase
MSDRNHLLTETTPAPADQSVQPETDTTVPAADITVAAAPADVELPFSEPIEPAAPEAESPKPAPVIEAASSVIEPVAVVEAVAEAPVPETAEPEKAPDSGPDLAPDSPEAIILASEPEPVESAEPEAPRTVFADLGLSEPLLRAIAEMGYNHPTPIQEQAIPIVLMGRDVMGVAQTGTGKTASFTLPLMDILAGSRARARMPRSLILEPTRELALQVAENFVQYGKHLKLNHALLIGGESMADQKDALMKGVDVLIATPGRLIDLFERGGLLMTDARILVIDEADRMLDMGFIPDVERIVAMLPRNRQTLFFSATMAPEIKRLSDAFLQNPKIITVSRPASVATTIVAGLALVAEIDKREALRRLIRSEQVQNAMIFCNRKIEVDVLYKSLKKHEFSVGALHGDLSQTERTATMAKFKAGELRLLVCSDVAARGVDISGLSHVFNFDVPHHAEDYVHRIGRTGRAGMVGHAFTLATPDDRLAVEAIESLVGAKIPRLAVDGLDPVEWAEGDGRKRRGRGAKGSKSETKPSAKPRRSDADRKPAADPAAELITADKPEPRRRTRTPKPAAPVAEAPIATPVAEMEAPPPSRAQRDRRPRDQAPREVAAREPERNHRDRPPRREGRYRDDDLGPAVQGFGDDIPAFMLIRSPARANRTRQTEETTA